MKSRSLLTICISVKLSSSIFLNNDFDYSSVSYKTQKRREIPSKNTIIPSLIIFGFTHSYQLFLLCILINDKGEFRFTNPCFSHIGCRICRAHGSFHFRDFKFTEKYIPRVNFFQKLHPIHATDICSFS